MFIEIIEGKQLIFHCCKALPSVFHILYMNRDEFYNLDPVPIVPKEIEHNLRARLTKQKDLKNGIKKL